MNEFHSITPGSYSHDLLIHHDDHDLVAGTVAFVEQGLSSGGQVLVHSSEERVAMLRSALGTHPRLDYGLDRDLYLSPMSTLFQYQRAVSQSRGGDLWVTGTVPFGQDVAMHPAWTRYESLVNEVLGRYPFHALCTYDTRILPAATVAAAQATHPCLSNGVDRVDNPGYMDPGAFITDPRADSPYPPASRPSASATLCRSEELRSARQLIADTAKEASAVSRDAIDGFVLAANEILANGLEHGIPPVKLAMWAEVSKLTCLVTDDGPGITNPLAGYRELEADVLSGRGLWLARRLCQELIIRNSPFGGCAVLLTSA